MSFWAFDNVIKFNLVEILKSIVIKTIPNHQLNHKAKHYLEWFGVKYQICNNPLSNQVWVCSQPTKTDPTRRLGQFLGLGGLGYKKFFDNGSSWVRIIKFQSHQTQPNPTYHIFNIYLKYIILPPSHFFGPLFHFEMSQNIVLFLKIKVINLLIFLLYPD